MYMLAPLLHAPPTLASCCCARHQMRAERPLRRRAAPCPIMCTEQLGRVSHVGADWLARRPVSRSLSAAAAPPAHTHTHTHDRLPAAATGRAGAAIGCAETPLSVLSPSSNGRRTAPSLSPPAPDGQHIISMRANGGRSAGPPPLQAFVPIACAGPAAVCRRCCAPRPLGARVGRAVERPGVARQRRLGTKKKRGRPAGRMTGLTVNKRRPTD